MLTYNPSLLRESRAPTTILHVSALTQSLWLYIISLAHPHLLLLAIATPSPSFFPCCDQELEQVQLRLGSRAVIQGVVYCRREKAWCQWPLQAHCRRRCNFTFWLAGCQDRWCDFFLAFGNLVGGIHRKLASKSSHTFFIVISLGKLIEIYSFVVPNFESHEGISLLGNYWHQSLMKNDDWRKPLRKMQLSLKNRCWFAKVRRRWLLTSREWKREVQWSSLPVVLKERTEREWLPQ